VADKAPDVATAGAVQTAAMPAARAVEIVAAKASAVSAMTAVANSSHRVHKLVHHKVKAVDVARAWDNNNPPGLPMSPERHALRRVNPTRCAPVSI
jgi:hypothetical protein